MATTKIANIIVSLLADAGIKRIYGLIGDSLNPIGDAVRVDTRIDWIGVRHEENAALAASGEAFLTNDLCVCAGTAGPGSVHLINGLYEANQSNTPVLAIVTDLISSEEGLGSFQATTPMRLYEDCSVFCERLSSVSQMPRLFQAAMQAAQSYKGVAVIIISKDISEAELSDSSPYFRQLFHTSDAIIPKEDDVKKMADIINQYKNITLYCGRGCQNATEEVLDLAGAINAPVVSTLRSKDFISLNNPYYVGMNGPLSRWESKYALDNCDLLIMLGIDYHGTRYITTKPTIIQVDLAGKHLGRRNRLDFGLVGDMKITLQALKQFIKPNTSSSHLEASRKAYLENEEKKHKDLREMKKANSLRPELLTNAISKVADYNAAFVVDVGLNDIWAARYLEAEPNRIIMGSFKHGTLGATIGIGMGAYFADPKRQIVTLTGDGGLTMLLGELLTLVQYKIPLKIVVYNNREFGFIKLEAQMEKIPPFSTKLQNPDFAKLAEVIGIKSFHVDSPQNLEKVLNEAFKEEGPVLIDAITDSEALGYFEL